MDKGRGGGSDNVLGLFEGSFGVLMQPMWVIFKFYNIIIKSANVDKGVGVKHLSTKCG